MNYINKLVLIALYLIISFPLYASIAVDRCEKNDISTYPVVNAFLNNIGLQDPTPSTSIKKIVIDAGHGGKDHGCAGFHSNEKHIVLNIAKELKKKLRQYHPEVEVILTRENDVFIPLFKRLDIANKSEADLFISIHCNSFDQVEIHGSETFVMGLSTADENLQVAKRENASILLEKDYWNHYDNYDPYSSEGHIMLAMSQNVHLNRSINFAQKLETSFRKRTKLKSRGVKQAGFVVLREATMPSVLVEAGFLSNKKDENYLMSNRGQLEIADAMVKAITLYKREIEEESNENAHVQSYAHAANQHNTTVQRNTPPQNNYVSNDPNHHKIISVVPDTKPAAKQIVTHTHDPNHHKVISTSQTASQTNQVVKEQASPKPKVSLNRSKTYKVQIAASIKKPLPNKSSLWKNISDLEIRKEDDMYKYLTGSFISLADANAARNSLLTEGFKGAFVVAYKDGRRTNL